MEMANRAQAFRCLTLISGAVKVVAVRMESDRLHPTRIILIDLAVGLSFLS